MRCIVRRPSVIETIKSGPSVQPYIHLIEFSVVPDNAVEGAYNQAIAGADYVVHIAGAWPLPHLHPDNDIYNPFIRSTKNLVEAAKISRTVKRIAVTQAGAGLVDAADGDTLGRRMNRVMDGYYLPTAISTNDQSNEFVQNRWKSRQHRWHTDRLWNQRTMHTVPERRNA